MAKLVFVYEGDSERGGSGQSDAAKQITLSFIAETPMDLDEVEEIRSFDVRISTTASRGWASSSRSSFSSFYVLVDVYERDY
jgi:hypothetical protein